MRLEIKNRRTQFLADERICSTNTYLLDEYPRVQGLIQKRYLLTTRYSMLEQIQPVIAFQYQLWGDWKREEWARKTQSDVSAYSSHNSQ